MPSSWLDRYSPRLASLEYTSSASFRESGASPIRSKILSGSSPRLYARTTWVCRQGCSTLWDTEKVEEVIDAADGSAVAILRE
jgi:hypothetical protein